MAKCAPLDPKWGICNKPPVRSLLPFLGNEQLAKSTPLASLLSGSSLVEVSEVMTEDW